MLPAWSPDGSRLLFTSDQNVPDGDSQEVYSIAADGSCLTWLTNGSPGSGVAAWRPGSGDDFGPGSCDPAARTPVVGIAPPKPFRGGLWLGLRYRGLLYSTTPRRGAVSYDDCERFSGCPATVRIVSETSCRVSGFRGLTGNAYRFVRRRGAILAIPSSEQAGVRVFSGNATSTVWLGDENRLSQALRVIRDLRPYGASEPPRRLAAPRVPRAFARRLDATARAAARLGIAGAARALDVTISEVRRTLTLRRLLRPYRTC